MKGKVLKGSTGEVRTGVGDPAAEDHWQHFDARRRASNEGFAELWRADLSVVGTGQTMQGWVLRVWIGGSTAEGWPKAA